MKAHLLYRDKDLSPEPVLPVNHRELTQDLELNTLWKAMARDDTHIFGVVKQLLLAGESDQDTIRYRQEILGDCLAYPEIAREIYQIAVDAITNKREYRLGIFTNYPSEVLNSSVKLMRMYMNMLRKLRDIADKVGSRFTSAGFRTFFTAVESELDDHFFTDAEGHLKELGFRNGVLINIKLGKGSEGTDFMLCKAPERDFLGGVVGFLSRDNPAFSFTIGPRDDHGARALGELRDQGIILVSNALSRSADHVEAFFQQLRTEMAFYLGCLNLAEQLAELGQPVCIPSIHGPGERLHHFQGLYDVSLALTINQAVTGNNVNADGKDLVIITGANQGGKSTFLRSVGLAQLMMQCGMYVPAESFEASLCPGVFTHYRRQEDSSMKSGKLDEELSRMSEIAEHLTPNAIVLFNESFAATNEREGSEIARQITNALIDRGIRVFFVTHQYEYAYGYYEKKMPNTLFLQAERTAEGRRTFQLLEGEPSPTSYGRDIYRTIFKEKP